MDGISNIKSGVSFNLFIHQNGAELAAVKEGNINLGSFTGMEEAASTWQSGTNCHLVEIPKDIPDPYKAIFDMNSTKPIV